MGLSLQTYVPIQQVVSRVDLRWSNTDPSQDRQRTLTVMSVSTSSVGTPPDELFQRVRPGSRAIPLPTGYSLDWGGNTRTRSAR